MIPTIHPRAAIVRGHGLLATVHAAASVLALVLSFASPAVNAADSKPAFHIEEATIEDIQRAILEKQITTVEVVKLYLARIKAYNGPGVEYSDGLLGPIKTIPHAKGIDALITLNLRPANLKAMGFDARLGRSMTDPADNKPDMPDALETAAEEDRRLAETGKLVGPLHGVVIAIKDQYDTFDMRSTSGADAFYANDRPPHDATFAKRLREAGAIILAKSNQGEYAGGYGHNRTSFGGVAVNPYDTERDPGGSSAGSGTSVGANLVTCAIGEETTWSIRSPAEYNSAVGFAPTQELVSRVGLIGAGVNTRVGPIARTVQDTARILTVIAGYDPQDEMTAFGIGRLPSQPYETFTRATSLKGMRIGVVREYMDRAIATKAELQTIALAEQAVEDLRKLGATIVDPGPQGLFTDYIRRYNPMLSNASFAKANPDMFPTGDDGKPATDQIAALVDLAMNPAKVPGKTTIRDFPSVSAAGEGRYWYDLYLARRGDANIKTLADLLTKANFYNDGPPNNGKPVRLKRTDAEQVLDMALRMQRRFAIQQIVLQCMAELNLDAVVYPTGTLPPAKFAVAGGRSGGGSSGGTAAWTFLGQQGFPAITVPAGFTTEVYDRELDPTSPAPAETGGDEGGRGASRPATRLVGPLPASLPVGVDFLGRPFSEPTLFTIAAAYEQATRHRMPPPDFGPLADRH
jgi:Asp-tRNA(Asn)/Glu-tRNA(Gln) amidotransferase A subunit family amidase